MSSPNLAGIDMLLKAASMIDRGQESENRKKLSNDGTEVLDHGYASSSPKPIHSPASRKSKVQPRKGSPVLSGCSRNLHNLMEKNRRADLRDTMEQLKHLIPTQHGVERLTTLQLLKFARSHIKSLEESHRRHEKDAFKLRQQQKVLRLRYLQLQGYSNMTLTENSEILTNGSTSPQSECDEVDVMSYSSGESATGDNRSSPPPFCRDSVSSNLHSLLRFQESVTCGGYQHRFF